MKKAVIYVRVSSEGDRQSTDRQVADLQAYAAGAGYEAYSALRGRPGPSSGGRSFVGAAAFSME